MKLFIYDSAYKLEAFDSGDFKDYCCYLENIANIIKCFANEAVILFPIEEDIFNDDDYEINRLFIMNRFICNNKLWIYNSPMYSDECPNIIWYEVKNIEEIIEALNIEQSFNCAIVTKDKSIEEIIYILNSNEEDDFNSLSIREKNNGNFMDDIFPKLNSYLKGNIEIIDLRKKDM
ncbi:hypothetical protein [Clostridium sp. JNZ J1-5]